MGPPRLLLQLLAAVSRRPFLGPIVLAFALSSCAQGADLEEMQADDPSKEPAPEVEDELRPIDVRALSRQVAEVRRLTLDAPIHVQAFGDGPFRALLDRRWTAGHHVESVDTWSAFGFAPEGTEVDQIQRRVNDEGMLGFYDHGRKQLFLRGAAGGGARVLPSRKQDRTVLAHEIVHALQDQHFDLDRRIEGDDAALAWRALVEGDATLSAQAVHLQSEPGREHWVSRVTRSIRTQALSDLLRKSGVDDRELGAAPPLMQRTTVFPYREGAAFVGDLYRAGGLNLVNRAYSDPPRSTEQILHPDRYLAGDWPVVIPRPEPPRGWTVRSTQTLGELATGVLLGQCVSREAGAEHAKGWGGDSFAVVADAEGHEAVVWSTIWDTEAAAKTFEADARARGDCVRGTNPGATGRDVVVQRAGNRVAYVQGLGPTLGPQQALDVLAVPVDVPAARPPFGPITIPPLIVPEKAFLGGGRFEKDAWVSEPMGIRIEIPEDFRPRMGSNAEAAMVHGADAQAAFFVLMTPPGLHTDRAFLRGYVESVRSQKWMEGRALDFVESGEVEVDGARGPLYAWRNSTLQYFKLVFLPACSGQATVVLTLTYSGSEGKLAAADWTKHFRLPAEGSPMCRYLETAKD